MKLSYNDLDILCKELSSFITGQVKPKGSEYRVFGVPTKGILAGLALSRHLNLVMTDEPEEADFIIDDILDSGDTYRKWNRRYPQKPFLVLMDKNKLPDKSEWVEFPWESQNQMNESVEGNVTRILQYIGENPKREGLLETPHRVAKAWKHWSSGYNVDIPAMLKVFEDGAEGCDEMVLVRDIPFYSHCEHHMAPFFGTATVAYLPNKKIVGLSKLSRLVSAYALRLQVQERLTCQIADAIMNHLDAKGAGVFISARHLCMESRGVEKQGSNTETTALRGVFLTDPLVRSEFLSRSTR